jgi:hypothetical protein
MKDETMKCNVGKTDRIVRIIAGVAIIGVGLYFQSWWGAIGIVPIATGVFRWCPAYVPFGIKTN